MVIACTMANVVTGDLVLIGKTMHCFTDANGKPIILKSSSRSLIVY